MSRSSQQHVVVLFGMLVYRSVSVFCFPTCRSHATCSSILPLIWCRYLAFVFSEQTLFKPLHVPRRRQGVPIQPGLFKGSYGAHGVEIVMVTYNDDNTEMNAVKITVCFWGLLESPVEDGSLG